MNAALLLPHPSTFGRRLLFLAVAYLAVSAAAVAPALSPVLAAMKQTPIKHCACPCCKGGKCVCGMSVCAD